MRSTIALQWSARLLQTKRYQSTSVIGRFVDFIGAKKPGSAPTTISSAKALLWNCKERTENPLWYSKGLMTKELRSKQTILMTHIWIIHKRLLKEGSNGEEIQECMFDELWDDAGIRLTIEGISPISINKYLTEIQKYSFKYCMSLDEALTKKTEEEIVDHIAGAIWRDAYIQNQDMAESHVIEFANYVRQEQLTLQDIPMQAILEGRIKWGHVPVWGVIADVEKEEKETELDPAGEWRKTEGREGNYYYWNTATREATFTAPAVFVDIISAPPQVEVA